jgi:GNAT superfamily N-acetyltransferase
MALTDPPTVRLATTADYPLLPAVEAASDTLLAALDIDLPPGVASAEQFATAACVLVVGDPPVGFARIDLVDGLAHLEQLSVHPNAGRRGIGTALLTAALEWATQHNHPAMTLSTYRDVPFNGPFYSRHGFTELTDLTPTLAQLRQHEQQLGLDAGGVRVVLRRDLVGGPDAAMR